MKRSGAKAQSRKAQRRKEKFQNSFRVYFVDDELFVTELLSIALRRVSRGFLVSFVALRLRVSVISLSAFSVSAPFAASFLQ